MILQVLIDDLNIYCTHQSLQEILNAFEVVQQCYEVI